MNRPRGGDWCCVERAHCAGHHKLYLVWAAFLSLYRHLVFSYIHLCEHILSYTSNIEHISVFLSATDRGLPRDDRSAPSYDIAGPVRRPISLCITRPPSPPTISQQASIPDFKHDRSFSTGYGICKRALSSTISNITRGRPSEWSSMTRH